jgi:UDP-N-acetylglucosamine:LPS N-acetylglucosamine transferase
MPTIICRAGASTKTEIASWAPPRCLSLPSAVDDHQTGTEIFGDKWWLADATILT